MKIPDVLPRFVAAARARSRPAARARSCFSKTSSARTSPRCFPGTQVKGAHLFRVVRDADLVIQEDEADDLLESIDQGLKQSRRGALADAAGREHDHRRRVLDTLVENFEIEDENVYAVGPPGFRRLDGARADCRVRI